MNFYHKICERRNNMIYSVCKVFQKEIFRVSLRCELSLYKYYLIMI